MSGARSQGGQPAAKLRIYVATRNEGKRKELWRLLGNLPVELVGPAPHEHFTDVVEDADTFAGNAIKKAVAAARRSGLAALADDSGLEVDALGGAPGVRSARYALEPKNPLAAVGPDLDGNADDEDNNARLLVELRGVPVERRTARFRCVIAFVDPQGPLGQKPQLFDGTCEGRIGFEPHGHDGFGYDPLFFLPSLGKTYAELTVDDKNRISHRAQAARALARVRAA
jgi:XTP/dITP diphosphohydrolase